MANQEQLARLKYDRKEWNKWRKKYEREIIDLRRADFRGTNLFNVNLSEADLSEADLSEANLSEANLSKADFTRSKFINTNLIHANFSEANLNGANLSKANLNNANFSNANLNGTYFWEATLGRTNFNSANLSVANLRGASLFRADFRGASLFRADFSNASLLRTDFRGASLFRTNFSNASLFNADLSNANLSEANLTGANLTGADLTGADLTGADLTGAILVETNMIKAKLINCSIYGISVWNVMLEEACQENLIITPHGESTITVDNLKIAQFLYLLLHNTEIRDVIDTVAKKAVLILGRFTPDRKVVLNALREALRAEGYVPILFDFEKPSNRDFTETVTTLAHLARFIIADLTTPSSIPQELQAIVPTLAIPVQPLLLEGERNHAMFPDFRKYPWVLPIHFYKNQADLITSLSKQVIAPAEQKAKEIQLTR